MTASFSLVDLAAPRGCTYADSRPRTSSAPRPTQMALSKRAARERWHWLEMARDRSCDAVSPSVSLLRHISPHMLSFLPVPRLSPHKVTRGEPLQLLALTLWLVCRHPLSSCLLAIQTHRCLPRNSLSSCTDAVRTTLLVCSAVRCLVAQYQISSALPLSVHTPPAFQSSAVCAGRLAPEDQPVWSKDIHVRIYPASRAQLLKCCHPHHRVRRT